MRKIGFGRSTFVALLVFGKPVRRTEVEGEVTGEMIKREDELVIGWI